MMKYPTITEAKNADVEQLARWARFLPSPGINYLNSKAEMKLEGGAKELRDGFESASTKDKTILDIIIKRLVAFGGITPTISKKIGWKPPS